MKGMAVLVLLALAGCTASPDVPSPAGPPAPLDLFVSLCPPGATQSPSADACTATLGGEAWRLTSPALALDRNNERRFAVAAIAEVPAPEGMGALTAGLPNPTGEPRPCRGLGMCVFWTEDAGATWTTSNPPMESNRTAIGPAALTFDVDGQLHLAVLFDESGTGGIQYARTADGQGWDGSIDVARGDAWRTPTIQARQNILAVFWLDTAGVLHGVEKFTTSEGLQREEGPGPTCSDHSAPVLLPTDYLGVVCMPADKAGVPTMWEFNHRHWSHARPLPAGFGPVVTGESVTGGPVAAYRAPDGRPLLVQRNAPPSTNWTALDLLERTDAVGRMDSYSGEGLALDERGNAHVLLKGQSDATCRVEGCAETSEQKVVVLSVSLASGGRVGQILLTPPAVEGDGVLAGEARRAPAAALAFWDERGVALWQRGTLLEWTIIGSPTGT